MSSPKACRITTISALLTSAVLIVAAGSAFPIDLASAETVVRDHRGPDGAPQGGVTGGKPSTVPGRLGGPKWKGGYDQLGGTGEKGAKSGVTVRDHRKK